LLIDRRCNTAALHFEFPVLSGQHMFHFSEAIPASRWRGGRQGDCRTALLVIVCHDPWADFAEASGSSYRFWII
jgi:hypothetical protein